LGNEFDLIYACGGQEAMDQVMLHKDMLSAVLLDLVMPEMDGFAVMDLMKADEDLARIPILVLTAEKTAELEALGRGASGFIPKPFESHEIILARVRSFVELAEGRRLIHAAECDPVTGLYTKEFFFSYASQIERFHPDWKMAEIALRISRYRLLGELYGQEFLDLISRHLAQRLLENVQAANGICARASQDTYYLFLQEGRVGSKEIKRLQKDLNSLREHLDLRLEAGICDIDRAEMNLRRRFGCAEAACGMVERDHADLVIVYDSKLHEKQLYRQRLINDLPRAIAEHELKVYYQPKYDITGDKPVMNAAEALVRWQHPEFGMIPPGDFIPLFESNGLIGRVDMYVWEESARQLREWKEQFRDAFDLTLSVNVSSMDIHMPGLEEKLTRLVDTYGIRPGELHLELTESAYMEDAQLMLDVTKHLRGMGFRVEMDDFGSGYSSLNMLSKLPVDVLKMDMMFVRSLSEENTREYRFIEIVHDIARMLEIPMIAEGVETAAQLELLRQIGCEYIQGYYFSPPVPAEKFGQLIQAQIEN
ncbi:MAG TPA: hypothetical protein DHV42_03685, partial [Lachnospiraceae bacterium]|nr:hypothetical protein [Lachnospiraceae bacterium]